MAWGLATFKNNCNHLHYPGNICFFLCLQKSKKGEKGFGDLIFKNSFFCFTYLIYLVYYS